MDWDLEWANIINFTKAEKLDCFLYLLERQTLFDLIEHYIPKFKNLSKHKKIYIILRGIDIENDDFIQLNTTLTIFVQNFTLHNKRFS